MKREPTISDILANLQSRRKVRRIKMVVALVFLIVGGLLSYSVLGWKGTLGLFLLKWADNIAKELKS